MAKLEILSVKIHSILKFRPADIYKDYQGRALQPSSLLP